MKDTNKTILITGAAGFISSFLALELNTLGYENLILVDDFSKIEKTANHHHLKYSHKIHRDQLMDWLEEHSGKIDFIFHLGARTDTAEFDEKLLRRLNSKYSEQIWEYASEKQIPLIYASSAATYGDGSLGFSDEMSQKDIEKLAPLNPYGWSKQKMDLWALHQKEQPPFWAALKFFNVYGPHENHKGRMASVVYHSYHQIQKSNQMKLFRSHREDYEDGGQERDFIYVKDVVNIMIYMMLNHRNTPSDIYNIGTGKARTFKDLATAVFHALGKEPNIEYIDTPEDIRDKYQYFTEATMDKIRAIGYKEKFYSLEEGVKDYVVNYLKGE